MNTNSWSCDFDESDNNRKINRPFNLIKPKNQIEIKGGFLITILFLEIKVHRFWEKMSSSISFNIDNSNLNILRDNEAINGIVAPPQASTSQ